MGRKTSHRPRRSGAEPVTDPRSARGTDFLATSSTSLGHTLLLASIIAALTLAAYWPSLPGDFVWDDQKMIPLNPLITEPDGLVKIWSPWTEQTDYWPLAYSTHWLEWRIWGTSAAGYRAANIALHIANALVLWRILLRLGVPAAWWCGLLFALHPVNVEAVVWVLQRKTTLSTLLFLAAIGCWLKNDECHDRRWLAAAWLAFLLALLTKTSAVMLPVTLLLIAWQRHGRLRRQDLAGAAPFFALALVMGLVGMYYQRYGAGAGEEVRGDGLLSRTAIAGRAVWFYWSKAVWPHELCFVYPKWTADTSRFETFLPALLVVAATVGLAEVWRRRRGPLWTGLLAGWLYYLVNLFPALGFSNIYFMRYALVADHWQYTALPGVLAALVGGAGSWLTRHSGADRRLALAPGVLVATLLAIGTFAYATAFSGSNELLWQDTLAKNPQAWLAEHNLALILFDRGEYGEALKHFRRAAEIEPNDAELNSNLAKAMVTQRELGEVIRQHRLAVEQDPLNPKYRADLAAALVGSYYAELDAGRRARLLEHTGYASCEEILADAERQLETALRAAPNHAQALNNRGLVHLARGQFEAAEEAFQKSLTINPQSARAHGNLASALVRLKRLPEALTEYNAALRLDPNGLEFAAQMAWLLATHPDAAIRDPQRAVSLAEQLSAATGRQQRRYLEILAAAYAGLSRYADAALTQREALTLPLSETGCRQLNVPEACSSESRLAFYESERAFWSPADALLLFW